MCQSVFFLKRMITWSAIVAMGIFASGFLSPQNSLGQLDIEFEPMPNAGDINSPNPVQALDVVYDQTDPERQAFHIFLPDTVGKFPVVIYFHGGGFTGGSRDVVFSSPNVQHSLNYFLENNIAFVSVGYRLIETDGPDDQGVIKCLSDSKRALQFIRHHFEELKIVPDQVALMGGSAGAGTALWLATRNDMADPNSTDPLFRESTRVNCVHLGGSQATYDITKWETLIFLEFEFTLEEAVDLLGFERISNFYGGIDSLDQLYDDTQLIQYRQDVDMLFHLTSDDPPIYMLSGSNASNPGEDLFHHGSHAITVHDQALAAGVSEVKAKVNFSNLDTTGGECGLTFVSRHLDVKTGQKGDLNGDGLVTLLDVAPFVESLTDGSPFNSKADVNCDGNVNLLDVQAFVALLTG